MSAAAAARAPALNGLTHLRAFAISFVFLYHYRLFAHPTWVDGAGKLGWTGVDLFFVLSGFLIARQLFRSIARRDTFSLREFYFKRLLRIVPAYLVVLACYVCFPGFREWGALPPLWKLLTFTQNLGLDLRRTSTFSHAWSLCIEEQFYLLLPLVLLGLLAMGAGRRAFQLLPLLFVAGLVIRAASYLTMVAPLPGTDVDGVAWYEWIYYPTWSRLDGLSMGIAIAALHELRPALWTRLAPYGNHLIGLAAVLLGVAYWQLAEPTSLVGSVVAFPFVAIAYGALVLGALGPSSLLQRHSRLTEWLARLSYAVYLVHKACVHLAQRELTRLGVAPASNLLLVCCIGASLAGALLLHVVVERPILRWRDRQLRAV